MFRLTLVITLPLVSDQYRFSWPNIQTITKEKEIWLWKKTLSKNLWDKKMWQTSGADFSSSEEFVAGYETRCDSLWCFSKPEKAEQTNNKTNYFYTVI